MNFKIMSDYWKLNVPDYIKAFIMAVIAAFIGAIYEPINQWVTAFTTGTPIVLDWGVIFSNAWHLSLGVAITYILKQLGTSANGETFGIKKTAAKPSDL
jgi:hypothetical protein